MTKIIHCDFWQPHVCIKIETLRKISTAQERVFIFVGGSTQNSATVYSIGNYLCICRVTGRRSTNLCFDLGKTSSTITEGLTITYSFQTKMWCSNLGKFRANTENHLKNGCFFRVKWKPVSENSFCSMQVLKIHRNLV